MRRSSREDAGYSRQDFGVADVIAAGTTVLVVAVCPGIAPGYPLLARQVASKTWNVPESRFKDHSSPSATISKFLITENGLMFKQRLALQRIALTKSIPGGKCSC